MKSLKSMIFYDFVLIMYAIEDTNTINDLLNAKRTKLNLNELMHHLGLPQGSS